MAISTATISVAADGFKPEGAAGNGLQLAHPSVAWPGSQPAASASAHFRLAERPADTADGA
jgi:hypothetical protein